MKSHASILAGLTCLATMLYGGGVLAQVDLSGNWLQESDQSSYGPGPFADDFSGIPINQGRAGALSYSAEERDEIYRQCQPWSPAYIILGPFGGRIAAVHDQLGRVVAWYIGGQPYDRRPTTVWMDGRQPPPPLALHTDAGFTSGEWQGETLVTNTTLIKDGYLERNGVRSSNQLTVEMFFTRHGDELMLSGVVRDPIYLEAPWVLSTTLRLNTAGDGREPLAYCMPAETDPPYADGRRAATELPDQIAVQRPYMKHLYNIPVDAAMGGAQTMYPEFRKAILSEGYKPPSGYCRVLCCDPAGRVCQTPAD